MIPSALLESIRLHPEENGPREALASWYEQQGDQRARFIRYQLERHQLERLIDDLPNDQNDQIDAAYRRKYELEDLETLLLNEYGAEWLADMGLSAFATGNKRGPQLYWERGLISSLYVTWDRLREIDGTKLQYRFVGTLCISSAVTTAQTTIEDLIALLEAAPPVVLELSYPGLSEGQLSTLFASPVMSTIQGLDLRGLKVSCACLESLFASEYLTRLRILKMMHMPDCLPVYSLIAGAKGFQALEDLYIGWCKLPGAAVEVLANSTTLRKLRSLDFTYSELPSQGLVALLRSPILDGVKVLDFSGAKVNADVVDAMVKCPFLNQLETLDMSSTGLTGELLKAFLQATNIPSLKHLRIGGIPLGVDDVTLVANSTVVSQLHSLAMSFAGLSYDDAAVLFRGPSLKNLSSLDLCYNSLSADSVKQLATSPSLARLRKLDLSSNRFNDDAYDLDEGPTKTLRALATMESLRELDLSFGDGAPDDIHTLDKSGSINSDAMLACVQSGWLSSLYTIDLRGCELGDEWLTFLENNPKPYEWRVLQVSELPERGAIALCNEKVFPKLRKISLSDVEYSSETWASLAKRFGPQYLRRCVAKIQGGTFLRREDE